MNAGSSPRRTAVLAAILLALVLVWVLFRQQIGHSLSVRLLLDAKSPRAEAFQELAAQSADPMGFLNDCWATGKVTHRLLVAAYLRDNAATAPQMLQRAESLVLAGATDADFSVRELALAALDARKSPRLFECARAQVYDLDPMVRLLGLDYLRRTEPQKAVPVLVRLLDDPDLRIVAGAEVILSRWSDEDYGVRVRMAIPPQEGPNAGQIEPGDAEVIRRGVERRKQWWASHAKEYSPDQGRPTDGLAKETARQAAADFTLRGLNGTTVRLADLRGRVVLINFWATWCTACLAEIPELIALQKKLGDKVAILGIALDGVPNEDEHAQEQEADTYGHQKQTLQAIRTKVERAVKARGINYPILLDPESLVGGQFNGGELPTTVILDQEGRVRRRFLGERTLAVFEAMLAEASQPFPSAARQTPNSARSLAEQPHSL